LLGSAAGAVVNLALPPDAVLAWGWRIPFAVGVLVALGGLWIRRHYVERVPQQMPAKSPIGEAFRSHWKTMAHLILLSAGLSVGFYTTFVYSATWLHKIAQVPESRALGINTAAMALLLVVAPLSGLASDRYGRRRVLAWAAGGLALFAYPLMALMSHGTAEAIFAGQAGLAILIGTAGGALPAAMAELTPWRVRCTVLSVGYNVGMALLGGTTPMVATWLLARSGHDLAPAIYLAVTAALAFLGALLLPQTARHSLTREFSAVRLR
jgi:MHS family proline/betaine transporter-like MFS transporter